MDSNKNTQAFMETMGTSLPVDWKLNDLLFDLSQELTEAEVKNLKFLFRGDIGQAVLEKITTASEFFDWLRSRNFLNKNYVSLLEDILKKIGRLDLVRKIKDYSTNLSTSSFADLSDIPLHQKVLNKARTVLLNDMDSVSLLDVLLEKQVLDYQIIRDIQEQHTTTEKNRQIIKHFFNRDGSAYNALKECLIQSHQTHLVDHLTSLEVKEQQEHSLWPVQPIDQQENWNKIPSRNLGILSGQNPMRYMDGQPDGRIVPTTTDLPTTFAEINLGRSNDEGNAAVGRTRSVPRVSVGLDITDAKGDSNNTASDEHQFAIQMIKTGVNRIEKLNEPVSRTVTSVGFELENQARPIIQSFLFEESRNGAPIMGSMPPIFPSSLNLRIERSFHDGRLQPITSQCLNNLKKNFEKNPIGQGGFGKVFRASADVSGLGIPLAVKEIECDNDETLKSVINEKLAGRIMHFAIVPLLAFAEDIQKSKKFYYFLSPYLSNGSLLNAIQKDNTSSKKDLLLQDRIRILYQIASAIDFLHTSVVGLRNITLHRDITSNNIVLDDKYNARLIDFGLAYELKEGSRRPNTTLLSGKTNGYMGDDYPDFGIVVRELLTGRKPVENDEKLSTLDKDVIEIYIMDNLDVVWCNNSEEKKLLDVANELNILSETCLKNITNDKTKPSVPEKDVMVQLKTLLKRCDIPGWQKGEPRAADKCEVCMVNPIVQDLIMQENECRNHVRICVACLRNTYLNPIQCHSCFKDIEPTIGHCWGALLLAGNTVRHNKKEAKTFIKDVQDLKKILVSKSPLIMGLSEANVMTVKADDNVSIKDELSKKFATFKEKGLQKLIIYFRGYFTNGFLIGKDNECYSKNELHYQMKTLHERGVKLFLIILDCCYDEVCIATHSDVDFTLDNTSIPMVQMLGCEPHQIARNDDGGVFTKFLIQALRGESVKMQCFINRKKGNPGPCVICNKFQTEHKLKCYITSLDIQEYAQQHLKEYHKIEGLENVQKPLISMRFVSTMDSIIAYYIDTEVVYKFCLSHVGKKETIDMTPDKSTNNFQDIIVLLFDKFIDKMKLPKLDPTEFADIIRIIAYEKKGKLTDEIDSIEKMVSAWIGHQEPIVTLRDITNLSKGKVGLILADNNADIILKKFQEFADKFPLKCTKCSCRVLVQLEAKKEIFNIFKDCKEFKDIMFNAMKVNHSLQESGKNQTYNLEIIFPKDEREQIMKDFVCLTFCGSDN